MGRLPSPKQRWLRLGYGQAGLAAVALGAFPLVHTNTSLAVFVPAALAAQDVDALSGQVIGCSTGFADDGLAVVIGRSGLHGGGSGWLARGAAAD